MFFGGHCGARVPWEHHVDVLHPEKPQAFPVLPTVQSVTGLGALALSCLAEPHSWGDGVSDFMAISHRGDGGCQWVLRWAGWFPAGRGETPPVISWLPRPTEHRALRMLPDQLLSPALPSHCAGAAGHPGPGAGLLRACQRQTGQHPHCHPEGGEDQPDLRERPLGSHLQTADQPQVCVLPGGAHRSGHAADLPPGDCNGLHCRTASAPFSPWPGKAMAEPRPLRVWS